jgi:hypothetical protein
MSTWASLLVSHSFAQKYQSHYTAWIETKNQFDNSCIKNYTYAVMIHSNIIYCLNVYSWAKKITQNHLYKTKTMFEQYQKLGTGTIPHGEYLN